MITYINVEERQETNAAARDLVKIDSIENFRKWNKYFKVIYILYMSYVLYYMSDSYLGCDQEYKFNADIGDKRDSGSSSEED